MASSWIWQQSDWPQFRWNGSALEPLLEQARAERQELLSRLETLEHPLDREAISALLGRESLGTAAIEGELLDPGQVRSSIARRLQLPLVDGQPAASAQVEGLLDVLLEATSSLEAPLSLATLHHWHRRLFAAGPDGLRAIRIGELRDQAPMQVLSGAIGRERLHFEAPPRAQLEQQLDGLLRADLAHLWFLTLHPYEDGNGRLARAITDRLLAEPWASPPRSCGSGRGITRQSVAGCRTGGFHKRHDLAQGHQPHQGEPSHGLARSGRTGGTAGDRADRRGPQPRLSPPLARRTATSGWRIGGNR